MKHSFLAALALACLCAFYIYRHRRRDFDLQVLKKDILVKSQNNFFYLYLTTGDRFFKLSKSILKPLIPQQKRMTGSLTICNS
jgi:hypothetical protein